MQGRFQAAPAVTRRFERSARLDLFILVLAVCSPRFHILRLGLDLVPVRIRVRARVGLLLPLRGAVQFPVPPRLLAQALEERVVPTKEVLWSQERPLVS
jgi:hypothetical protein